MESPYFPLPMIASLVVYMKVLEVFGMLEVNVDHQVNAAWCLGYWKFEDQELKNRIIEILVYCTTSLKKCLNLLLINYVCSSSLFSKYYKLIARWNYIAKTEPSS